jgi:SAM-dependent methyltransferase
MTTTTHTPAAQALDEERVKGFSEQIFGHLTGSFVTFMIDIGHRTGLFHALSREPATSSALAARSGLHERYVREWLGAIVTAGIGSYEPTTGQYTLPAEHAVCLVGDTPLNIAPLGLLSGLLAQHIEPVAQAFRHGGGVPYSDYRPGFTDVMDQLGRATFDRLLVDTLVPLTGDLADRLETGIRVADIGCGTGHSTNILARAFPASTFVGYDIAEDAIDAARQEASSYGLQNVAFEVLDVTQLPAQTPLEAVFAFDAIHDQTDPVGVLNRVYDALAPGGSFVMLDIRASSHLENNMDNPVAPMLYGISTLHCLTVSLADGGAGLGTVWGHELAGKLLAESGFVDIRIHTVPDDPLDLLYVTRKPNT